MKINVLKLLNSYLNLNWFIGLHVNIEKKKQWKNLKVYINEGISHIIYYKPSAGFEMLHQFQWNLNNLREYI